MKILVVDDHVLIREALRGVLKELRSDAVILEGSDGRRAMELVGEHADIGLILLDLNLPDADGFSMLAELRERHPGISVVVLSAQQDRGSVVKALDLGALGFIPKSAQREVMLAARELNDEVGGLPRNLSCKGKPCQRQRNDYFRAHDEL